MKGEKLSFYFIYLKNGHELLGKCWLSSILNVKRKEFEQQDLGNFLWKFKLN